MKIFYVDLEEDLNLITMSEMTIDEIQNFVLQGTFTGKHGTVNKNGRSHIVPIWYTLNKENNIIFNTGKILEK